MHIDVVELEQFYKSRLGLLVQRSLRARVRELWPSAGRDAVLGLGFANPLMARYAREAVRVVIAQPAQQGADWWEAGGGNVTTLVYEDELPFADGSFDRIVALHLLENTDSLAGTLREVWRVLAPEGRFIAIVPNRSSLWARLERTPFGHGRPFSRGQINRVLTNTGFEAERHKQALYYPPSRARLMVRIAEPWERLQSGMIGAMGGVHIIEAVKRVESLVPQKGLRVKVRLPRPRPALRPVGATISKA